MKEEGDQSLGPENDCDDELSEDNDAVPTEQAGVRELRHKIESTFTQPKRRLHVKEVTFLFDESSVYGNRSGAMKGLLITSKATSGQPNMFHKSKTWKRQIVSNIVMCPRDEMWKPSPKSLPTMASSFTDVQECRQKL